MANDKDFILKNAVEVGGPTNVTLGTVTNDDLDLSTGNYFKDTPTGTSTYTFSNAGDVQSFQLEVTGGTAEVAQNFSTTLYTGNGSTQTITNGIDLATDGGLVWTKNRDSAFNNFLYDTERGVNKYLISDSTIDQQSVSDTLTSFNSNGFTLGGSDYGNITSGNAAVSWTFKKAAGFFDVVTWTGDGNPTQQIAHNLGVEPAVIIAKRTDSGNWFWPIYHRKLNGGVNPEDYYLSFSTNPEAADNAESWGSTAPTSTHFTVGNGGTVNASGGTYVAYLFAHDTADDSLIKCDSYTGTGAAGNTITLGWEPQWLLIKRTDTSIADSWIIHDNVRGMGAGNDPYLLASSSASENSIGIIQANSTGFELTSTYGGWNASGGDYIYIAIRTPSDPAITWPSSVEFAGGVSPSAPAVGETDLFTFSTDDSGTTYVGVKTADNLS
jgi:hypothetical protein